MEKSRFLKEKKVFLSNLNSGFLIDLASTRNQFKTFFLSHLGLLADKLESYVLPFRVAGGITLVGAFIPFMLLCYRSESQRADRSQREEEKQKLLK